MRICLLNITSGGMSGGYRTYLLNLIPRLVRHPDVSALLVGVPEKLAVSSRQDMGSAVQWLALRSTMWARGREVGRKGRAEIQRFAPDVIFIPTARYLAFNDTPVVNMVRNMMPVTLHHTAYAAEWLRNWARVRQMQRAVRNSDRVIAVSRFVRDYLKESLDLAEDRVAVVYHGIVPPHEGGMEQPAMIPNDLQGSFAFTAGLIYPYRGLEDLIAAWRRMRGCPDLPRLVIAGKVGQGMSRYYAKLRRSVEREGLQEWIRFVGVLNGREMAWCYENCSVFVMTSRVEACPNIALEAMAHGCVSVAADNAPLPEFFADAALYYPPGNSASLSERIGCVLSWTPDERSEASGRALARASAFTWDECCAKTVQELQKATV